MTPSTQRDLATIMDPAATPGQLADLLYRHAAAWAAAVIAGVAPELRSSGILADASHARLHEQRECAASGCRRQVWPAVGEMCEECFKREEELEKVRESFAAALVAGETIGPYVKTALGVYDDPTEEGWRALAAAEARGRAAGLREAGQELYKMVQEMVNQGSDMTAEAFQVYSDEFYQRAAELEQARGAGRRARVSEDVERAVFEAYKSERDWS